MDQPQHETDRLTIRKTTIKSDETAIIIHLRGLLDEYSTDRLSMEIKKTIADGYNHILFDLAELQYTNHLKLGPFIEATKALVMRGGSVGMYSIPPNIRQIIELLGLDQVMPIFSTRDEAVASIIPEG